MTLFIENSIIQSNLEVNCVFVHALRPAEIPPLARKGEKPDSIPMTAAEALLNAPEFTVSELSSALKRTVEDAYGHVRVRGEISGFRGPHSSGHCYFALKAESAKIAAWI